MEGWKDGRMEGWKDGRMEGGKDGRMEGLKNGRIKDLLGKQKFFLKLLNVISKFFVVVTNSYCVEMFTVKTILAMSIFIEFTRVQDPTFHFVFEYDI
jgi:hypothetical protein